MGSSTSVLTGSVATKFGTVISNMPEYARASYSFLASKLGPTLLFALQKTKVAWTSALPYIKAGFILSTTPLGISIIVLSASIVPLRLSRSTKSSIKSIGLLALGILVAGCGGFLFARAIPSLKDWQIIS